MNLLGFHSRRQDRRPVRRRTSRPQITAGPERLESRIALAVSTTVVAPSVGQSLTSVVSTSSQSGQGLAVSDTAGFAAAPGYALLSQAVSQAPFATVSYGGSSSGLFSTLATIAGDATQPLLATTTVTQAAQSTTANTSETTFGALGGGSITVNAGAVFTGTGFAYVLGAGGNGVFQYNVKTSTLPSASAQGTLQGLKLVGALGVASGQSVATITVPSGSILVESTAPIPGATLVTKVVTLPTANKPFRLPVVSTGFGFAAASATKPGFLLVPIEGSANPLVVNYTGISGTAFTGCTTTATGTVAMNAAVTATANAPITFSFKNNAPGMAVHVAIAGKQVDLQGNPTFGYLVPQSTGGKRDLTKPLQFVSMAAGTPPATVPTFQLFGPTAKEGSLANFVVTNSPFARLDSTRVVFSYGLPPVIPIVSNEPQFPAANNPTDPNNQINYDFFEFTQRYTAPNDGELFINTTQVDQVGIPFTMNVSPADSGGKSAGVGIKVARSTLASIYPDYIATQFLGDNGMPLAADAQAAYQALVTPYRLLNPSDAITNPPPDMTKAGQEVLRQYFDASLTEFFSRYQPTGSFRLQRDGFNFVGQTVTGFEPLSYQYDSVTLAAGTLSFPAVAVPGGMAPANVSLGTNLLVTGPGITDTAVVTAAPSIDVNNVTTVSIAGTTTSGTGTYTFQVPGQFTVLELQQADANWTVVGGGQTYRIYAPFLKENRPRGTFPDNFPHGTGLGSLAVASGDNSGFTPNTVGTLTFSGGGATTTAEGFFVTDGSGTIASVALTKPGAGYTSLPTISFSGAGTGTATVHASFVPAAPPWTGTLSSGAMVFGCLGAFADGIGQANAGQLSGTGATSQILLDVENTIVSAFNRGVANAVPVNQDVTAAWNDAATFYPKANTTGSNWANYYAGFLHQPGVSVTKPDSQVGLAYGFAYDDQGGNDPTLTSAFPTKVTIKLNRWASAKAPTPLTFTVGPAVKAGVLSFTAQGVASKTYQYILYQVPNAASGQWTQVGSGVVTTANTKGVVTALVAAPQVTAAGTYVLVLRATGATDTFGGQYDVSARFVAPSQSLQSRARALAPARLAVSLGR